MEGGGRGCSEELISDELSGWSRRSPREVAPIERTYVRTEAMDGAYCRGPTHEASLCGGGPPFTKGGSHFVWRVVWDRLGDFLRWAERRLNPPYKHRYTIKKPRERRG